MPRRVLGADSRSSMKQNHAPLWREEAGPLPHAVTEASLEGYKYSTQP